MKKFSFMQDWGTYSNETLVVVGMTLIEILNLMRRKHCKKELVFAFAKQGRPRKDEDSGGFVWTRGGATLLWLPHWKFDLGHYATVVHETNHLVFDIVRDKGMRDESEAQAYQQEYLFTNIIRKLNKFSGVKSKRKR